MKKWKHPITGTLCLGMVVLYCALRDWKTMALADRLRTLCDGFTIPGILCLCAGTLVWVSGQGFFDGLGYCLSVTRNALFPSCRRGTETYYDYIRRHQKSRKADFCFLFVYGGICLAIALLFVD
jgi:hypothetical protein